MSKESPANSSTTAPHGLENEALDPIAPEALKPVVPQQIDTDAIQSSEKFGKTQPIRDLDTLIGKIVDGKYRVLSRLGSGGMGAVFRAEHQLMERTVALKVLHPHLVANTELLKRFQHEARIASKLRHPNAIATYDCGMHDGCPYLVMEFVEGRMLSTLIAENGSLPIKRVVEIFRQAGSALAQAHQLGIIHRDLKPDNIMLVPQLDGTEIAVVLDFGIAKVFTEQPGDRTALTQAGMFYGTPRYASPEQVAEQTLDQRSDIYALGVMLYEAISGDVPFNAPSVMELLIMHLQKEPLPLREFKPELQIPASIDAIVMKCLQKRPEDRFQTVEELLDALDATLSGPVTTPTDEAMPLFVSSKDNASTSQSNAGILISLSLLVLFGAAAGTYWLTDELSTSTPIAQDRNSGEPQQLASTVEPEREKVGTMSAHDEAASRTVLPDPVSSRSAGVVLSAVDTLNAFFSPSEGTTGSAVKRSESTTEEVLVETQSTSPVSAADSDDSLMASANPAMPTTARFEPNQEAVSQPDTQGSVTQEIDAPAFQPDPQSSIEVGNATTTTASATQPVETTSDATSLSTGSESERDNPAKHSKLAKLSESVTLAPLVTDPSSQQVDTPSKLDEKKATQDAIRNYNAGMKLYQQRRYAEAAVRFEQAVAARSDAIRSFNALGTCYQRLGQFEKAKNAFTRAIRIDPKYSPAHYNFAALHAVTGETDMALKRLAVAVRLDPNAKRAARNEPDFANLRGNAAFRQLVGQ